MRNIEGSPGDAERELTQLRDKISEMVLKNFFEGERTVLEGKDRYGIYRDTLVRSITHLWKARATLHNGRRTTFVHTLIDEIEEKIHDGVIKPAAGYRQMLLLVENTTATGEFREALNLLLAHTDTAERRSQFMLHHTLCSIPAAVEIIVPWLHSLLQREDIQDREYIVFGLGLCFDGSEKIIHALMKSAEDTSEQLAVAALYVLSHIVVNKEFVAGVADSLRTHSLTMQQCGRYYRSACIAYRVIDDSISILRTCITDLYHKDPDVVENALLDINRIYDAGYQDLVVMELNQEMNKSGNQGFPDLCFTIARACPDDTNLTRAIMELIDSPLQDVIYYSILAMRFRSNVVPEYIFRLRDSLKCNNMPLIVGALRTLRILYGYESTDTRFMMSLLQHPDACSGMLSFLAEEVLEDATFDIGSFVTALVECTYSENQYIRDTAIWLLCCDGTIDLPDALFNKIARARSESTRFLGELLRLSRNMKPTYRLQRIIENDNVLNSSYMHMPFVFDILLRFCSRNEKPAYLVQFMTTCLQSDRVDVQDTLSEKLINDPEIVIMDSNTMRITSRELLTSVLHQ
ncbi:MAG: hypothetical protein WC824_02870 [Bacteroidota bacterium]